METPEQKIARLEAENKQLWQLCHTGHAAVPSPEALLHSNTQSFTSLATIPVGIFRADLGGFCLYANPRCCEIVGLNPVAMIGKGWVERIHPDDLERVIKAWEHSLQTRQPFQLEYRFQRPDGTITWVLAQAEAEQNIAGQVIGYVGTITDISDRKDSEELLNSSLHLIDAHFDNAPLAIIQWDRDRRIVRWSKQAEKIFGWSEEDIKNMDIKQWQFVYEDDFEYVSSQMKALRERAISSINIQNRNYTKSGKVITCQWSTSLIFDEANNLISMLSFAEDISDRISAQEALKKSEARFQKIALSSPVGIYIQVIGADRSTRFEYMSPAGAEIFEMSIGQILEDPNFQIEFADPKDRTSYNEALNHSIEHLSPFFYEVQIRTATGKRKWIQASDRPERRENGDIAWYGVVLDITAHKRTEYALQHSEARLREAQQIAHIGNWEVDRRTGILEWSDEVARIFEFDPQLRQSDPHKFLEVIHPDDRIRVEQAYATAIKNHTLADLVYRIQMVDGRIKYVHEYGQTVFDRLGEPKRSFGTVQDITARILAEKALQHLVEGTAAVTGKEFFTALVSYLAKTLVVSTVLVTELIDEHLCTRAFWFDHKLQTNFNYTFQNTPCQWTLDNKIAYWATGIQQQFPEDANLRTLNADSYIGIALTNLAGKSIGVLCILDYKPLTNIPWLQSILQIFAARISAELERERAMQALEHLNQQLEIKIEERTAALRQSEERWQLALKGTNDGIWDWDVQGNRIFLSTRWKAMRGFTEAEVGESLEEWIQRIHPDDYDLVMTTIKDHFAAKTDFFAVEYRAQRKDGSHMWVLDRGQVLRDSLGNVIRMIGSETDITQRKLSEVALQRANQELALQMVELHRLDQLKDDFMSTVSHELRTPLSNMNMAIKLLKMNDTNPAKNPTYLQVLESECQREVALINDLLDLQRLEAGKTESTQDWIDLQTWIPDILLGFKDRTMSRHQSLNWTLAATLQPLKIDSISLQRVLQELVNNACKYAPDGGSIQVKVNQEPTHIIFQVINSGVGIPANELPYIFEKFYRVPNGDPWSQGGTGLGLALVKRLIENLQGTINVTSHAEETCFTFMIPCRFYTS